MSGRRSARVLLAGALLALAAAGSAQAGALDQLRGFLTQTHSASGEFEQRVGGRSKPPQASSGSFTFQRPGRFRWTYAKPYEQVIVADGSTLWLYDKDLNQVTVRTLTGALPSSPASILFGSNQFEKDFEVRDGGVRDGLEWIVATPRAKDSAFEKIEIGFKEGLPQAMQLGDSFGQTTLLRFTNLQRNPRLDAQSFRFTPPAGAEVVDGR